MDKQIIHDYFGEDYTGFYEPFIQILKIHAQELEGLCPFHDDTNPSLSINKSNGLYYCHACGARGDIFSFYARIKGLNADNGGFPEILKGISHDFGIESCSTVKKIVATYDYTDDENELLFQVVRYEPKDFKQRRSDGKGGWIWDLKGVRLVLYHLPEGKSGPDSRRRKGLRYCPGTGICGLMQSYGSWEMAGSV